MVQRELWTLFGMENHLPDTYIVTNQLETGKTRSCDQENGHVRFESRNFSKKKKYKKNEINH